MQLFQLTQNKNVYNSNHKHSENDPKQNFLQPELEEESKKSTKGLNFSNSLPGKQKM